MFLGKIMQNKITEEQKEMIKTLTIQGKSIQEISKETGVGESSVWYHRKRLGLTKKKQKLSIGIPKLSEKQLTEVLFGCTIKGFVRDNGRTFCVTDEGNGFSFPSDIQCYTKEQISGLLKKKQDDYKKTLEEYDNLNTIFGV